MGELLGILFCILFLMVGQIISACCFSKERPWIRLWLGGVTGLVLMITLPALWAFVFDFSLIAQYAALFTAVVVGILCIFVYRKRQVTLQHASWKEAKGLLILVPLFLVGAYLFGTHTIPKQEGALYVGQSTYGDLAMHLGFVTSLGEQGSFPPEYSILPGTQIGYPFLCDSISATFYVLGGNLRFSMLLPALLAYALVLLGVYFFFENWLIKKETTILATLLFFLGGGFGFAYFFDTLLKNPDNFSRIFTGYYITPTNYAEKGMLWVNPIADMLVPQRATLFGWALLFPALFLLRRAAFDREERMFLPLALLAGCMPLVHTHSFLALGILSAYYLFWDLIGRAPKIKLLKWGMYGGIVCLMAFPQLFLFTFGQAQGFIKLHFNWVNSTDTYLWFYLKNLGLIFLLLPLSFLNLNRKERRFYGGSVLIWLVAEVIQFQPNKYDNNKLLFVWFAFTCGITAAFLMKCYEILRTGQLQGVKGISADEVYEQESVTDISKGIKGRKILAVMVLCTLFTSGILTLGREAVSKYQLFSAKEVEASEFIKEHTQPDALFLTDSNHNNLVAALSGRNIYCGSTIYVHFIGLDYEERMREVELMYTQPETYFPKLAEERGIDYVLFSSYERNKYVNYDEAYYKERYPVFYQEEEITIYKIQ